MTKAIKWTVLGLAMVSVAAWGLGMASQADACCVYNDTGLKIKASWHLASDWHLEPNSHRCEENKKGTLDVIDDIHWASDVKLCTGMHVDHHGYVKIKQDGNVFTTTNYRKNGTIKDHCVRTIYSATRDGASENKE